MSHIVESLVIRADAGTQVGAGHLMRCLALAQAWKDAGGEVVFITACQNESLLQRLREEEFDVHVLGHPYPDSSDWDYTKDILAAHPGAWVVLDGYHFNELYQQRLKEAEHQLLVIDDMAHLKHYYADLILNQNLHADQLRYSCEPYTCLLLGTRYVLLGRDFLAWRGWQRQIPELARRVLVTLGGGDPENHTLKVIQALQKVDISGLEATVVIGASNPHADVLNAAIKQSHIPIRLIRNAKNMPELMTWADLAVSSAGITTWELLSLGIPTLFFILADNQYYIAEQIQSEGVGKTLGWVENITVGPLAKAIDLLLRDPKLRAKISENARQVVDGQGAQRTLSCMQEATAYRLKLRSITMEDCHLLWEWANNPVVRANSFDPNPIPWDEHVNWFHRKLADPYCLIYVGVDEQGMAVGQVRFDINSTRSAEIDITIDPKESNKGYGSAALKLACQCALQDRNIRKVIAHIKEENKASIKAFTKAGFINRGLQDFKGYKAVEMVWDGGDP